jgi:hypothetical protein
MTLQNIIRWMLTWMFIFSIGASGAQIEENKETRPVIGWIEYVALEDANIVVKARIDTGAGLASINAEIVEVKKSKDGTTEKVVFRIVDNDGNKKTMQRTIVEWINIKKKGGDGYIKRPVIKLDFCLGGKQVEARANLADRSDFLYPVLIGRNVLKAGDYMIDPEKTFTHEPGCK